MIRSSEMSWQVLFDEDMWETGEAATDAQEGGSALATSHRSVPKRSSRRFWIEMAVALAACVFLIGYFRPLPRPESPRSKGAIAAPTIERSLASEFFVFCFPQRELERVTELAPTLDARFAQMQRVFGLPVPTEKIVVEIAVGTQPSPLWAGPGKPLRIIAPPEPELSQPALPADSLPPGVLLPLSQWSVAIRLEQVSPATEWEIAPGLADGIHLWYQWENGLVDATARRRLVRQHLDYLSGLRLKQLSLLVNIHDYRTESMAQIDKNALAVTTLLAYGTKVYGPGRLPLLLEELAHYVVWADLIPKVFGVPAEEFEAGWQEWLAEEYEMAP